MRSVGLGSFGEGLRSF